MAFSLTATFRVLLIALTSAIVKLIDVRNITHWLRVTQRDPSRTNNVICLTAVVVSSPAPHIPYGPYRTCTNFDDINHVLTCITLYLYILLTLTVPSLHILMRLSFIARSETTNDSFIWVHVTMWLVANVWYGEKIAARHGHMAGRC